MASVPRIDWSADGRYLLIFSSGDPCGESHLAVCDADNGLFARHVDVRGGLLGAACISADARRILVGLVEALPEYGSLWQITNGSPTVITLLRLEPPAAVCAVAESPDGHFAAAGTTQGAIHLCHLAGGPARELAAHQGPVSDLRFSSDGRVLLSAGADSIIGVWSTETGRQVGRLEGHTQPVTSIEFLPGERRVISSSLDGTIRLWNCLTGESLWTAEADPFWVNSVCTDGQRAVSGGFGETIVFWDVATGQRVCEVAAHGAAVSSVKFSPDGRRLASGSYDGTVRLWEVGEAP